MCVCVFGGVGGGVLRGEGCLGDGPFLPNVTKHDKERSFKTVMSFANRGIAVYS